MVYNNARVSAADLERIEQTVRDRGEEHLIAISIPDSDHASVSVSMRDATRFYGERVYKLKRKAGKWRIEKVEDGQD